MGKPGKASPRFCREQIDWGLRVRHSDIAAHRGALVRPEEIPNTNALLARFLSAQRGRVQLFVLIEIR
jgi:hypothetical protein